jgi:hypothetical protein
VRIEQRANTTKIGNKMLRKARLFRYISILLAPILLWPSISSAVIAGGMVSNSFSFSPNSSGSRINTSVQVTHEPGANGNTFYANQFWFLGGIGGYVGIQQNSGTQKIAIFSIWNVSAAAPSTAAQCQSFGGEGTGIQCKINYSWVEGSTYTLSVFPVATGSGSGNSTWRATVTDQAGHSTTIGDIYVPASQGLLQGTVSQFVENFTQGAQQYASCSNVPPTTAVFRTPNLDGHPATSASTNTYGNCQSIASSVCTSDLACTATVNQAGSVNNQSLLQNAVNGYCADTLAGGSNVGLWNCTTKDANQILSIDASNHLKLVDRGLCLQSGSPVQATACNQSSSQEWLYIPSTQAFLNVGSNQCLDASGGGVLNAKVNTYSCNNLSYQKWKWVPNN